jgi:hypothetical protein
MKQHCDLCDRDFKNKHAFLIHVLRSRRHTTRIGGVPKVETDLVDNTVTLVRKVKTLAKDVGGLRDLNQIVDAIAT